MTHIRLDIEVLEVKGMLPNVNANDGDVGEEGVLVSSGCDLQTLGGGVVALREHRYFERPDGPDMIDIPATPSQNPGLQQW
jgi:hypothetical protein